MGDITAVRDLVERCNDQVEVPSGITFSMEAGDFVAVFGRFGSRKTTILSIISRFDRPPSSHVSIEGDDIVDMLENELARLRLSKIGFVFQNYNLIHETTVRENPMLPTRFSKRKNGRHIDILFEKFGIGHIAEEEAKKVSGSEAQRTAIARAMVNTPSILIADEPTGNLNGENSENVMDMLQLARADFGATIVPATHDERVADHANRWMCFQNGSIEQVERAE